MKFATLYAARNALDNDYIDKLTKYDNENVDLMRIERSFLNAYGMNWEDKLNESEKEEVSAVRSRTALLRIAWETARDALQDFDQHDFRL